MNYIPEERSFSAVWEFASSEIRALNIPTAVKNIDEKAFADCEDINVIYFYGDSPKIAEDAFENVVVVAYYPKIDGESTWYENYSYFRGYGGTLTWLPWNPDK